MLSEQIVLCFNAQHYNVLVHNNSLPEASYFIKLPNSTCRFYYLFILAILFNLEKKKTDLWKLEAQKITFRISRKFLHEL